MLKKTSVLSCVLFSLASLPALAADRAVVDCRAVKIYDDNVFEEGLSTEEYPDVDVDSDASGRLVRGSIGAFSYRARNQDRIQLVRSTETKSTYLLQHRNDRGPGYADRQSFIEVSLTQGPRAGRLWGRVLVRENGERAPRPVALLVCKAI
jgi:hypothetical protein